MSIFAKATQCPTDCMKAKADEHSNLVSLLFIAIKANIAK